MKSKFIAVLKSFAIISVGLVLKACGGNSGNLSVGMKAPDFTLSDAYGTKYSLSNYVGKEPLVVYFYPKASTPGCTKQACSISENKAKIDSIGFTVLGISVDSPEDIKKFIDTYKLNFPLLSDKEKEVSKKYGVLNALGFDSRNTFIIDKEGKIAKIMLSVDVSTHTEDIIREIKNIK